MTSASYWDERRDAIYLYAAKLICLKFASHPQSVIDVGSNGTPILEWFRGSRKLVSLDLRKPYVAEGIESKVMNLMDYRMIELFDLVTCFQVVEHIPDPGPFVQKLISLGRVVVISVPYKWPKGACKYHIHDPVTSQKLDGWANRKPVFTYIARELNKKERLIHVYNNECN